MGLISLRVFVVEEDRDHEVMRPPRVRRIGHGSESARNCQRRLSSGRGLAFDGQDGKGAVVAELEFGSQGA